jgi:hypothetical protein
MQKSYDAPELTLIGQAEDVVLGSGGFGGAFLVENTGLDFEFEQD